MTPAVHGNVSGTPSWKKLWNSRKHNINMALLGALHTLRSSLLARVSLPASRVQAVGAAGALSLLRGFAESTYLDKHVVTDRVLEVVKNFDKVDPSKVGTPRLLQRSSRVANLLPRATCAS